MMWYYFSDPVLSAPIISCMLMCLSAALIGTFVVLKKESLVGEALAHASYPGVVIALLIKQCLFISDTSLIAFFLPIMGAALSCFVGIFCIQFLVQKMRVAQDTSLCCVLTSFFGISLVIISAMQQSYPTLFKQMQSYLFGQAATLVDMHIILYFVLALLVIAVVLLFFRPISTVLFDPEFADVIGINRFLIDSLLRILIVIATVVAIRSVGVVLLSAMLVFPAASALQWTRKRLSLILFLAAIFGVVSAFLGIIMSHEMQSTVASPTGVLPTGPMIVMVAAAIFIFSILFAPERGLIGRMYRRLMFSLKCYQENLIKMIWRICEHKKEPYVLAIDMQEYHQQRFFLDRLAFLLIRQKGWIIAHPKKVYELSEKGKAYAEKIVRLHRLWELYLVRYCGISKERVHPSAEEMEHIITPEIEEKLVHILKNPKQDPHNQPIPGSAACPK